MMFETQTRKAFPNELRDTFKPCPFCGETPFIYHSPYKPTGGFRWVVECPSMGCVVRRSPPCELIKDLREMWNTRK
jgi:hypothetical protein